MGGQSIDQEARALLVGLTGGIAAGKSAVAAMFVELGAAHLDADQLARQVVANDAALLDQLVGAFGPEILDGEGRLDRKALGRIVFSDPAQRRQLEALTHPPIVAAARRELEALAARAPGRPVIYEAALLVEAGRAEEMDRLVVVVADDAVRLERLMARSGLTEQEARQRFASQLPQGEKAAVADHVIDNSGTLDQTRQQVLASWRALTGASDGHEP